MHLLLYVKTDFHVFYCDFAKPPLVCNDATCFSLGFSRRMTSESYIWFTKRNCTCLMKYLVCICHNRHEIDSNLANNACSSVMISKYL